MTGYDYFTSTDSGCEGHIKERTLGCVKDGPESSLDKKLYRCYRVADQDHFDSLDPRCDGWKTEACLGYVQAQASGLFVHALNQCARAWLRPSSLDHTSTTEYFDSTYANCEGHKKDLTLGYIAGSGDTCDLANEIWKIQYEATQIEHELFTLILLLLMVLVLVLLKSWAKKQKARRSPLASAQLCDPLLAWCATEGALNNDSNCSSFQSPRLPDTQLQEVRDELKSLRAQSQNFHKKLEKMQQDRSVLTEAARLAQQTHKAEVKALRQRVLDLESEAACVWPVISIRDVGEGTPNFAKHVRIECPGVEEDMIEIERLPNGVRVCIEGDENCSNMSATRLPFKQDFQYDHLHEGSFDLREDECVFENGVLELILKRLPPQKMKLSRGNCQVVSPTKLTPVSEESEVVSPTNFARFFPVSEENDVSDEQFPFEVASVRSLPQALPVRLPAMMPDSEGFPGNPEVYALTEPSEDAFSMAARSDAQTAISDWLQTRDFTYEEGTLVEFS